MAATRDPLEQLAAARRELAQYHGLLSAWATMHRRGAPFNCADPAEHDRKEFAAWLDEQRTQLGAWRKA